MLPPLDCLALPPPLGRPAAEEQFTRTMAFFGEDGTEMDPSTFLTTARAGDGGIGALGRKPRQFFIFWFPCFFFIKKIFSNNVQHMRHCTGGGEGMGAPGRSGVEAATGFGGEPFF